MAYIFDTVYPANGLSNKNFANVRLPKHSVFLILDPKINELETKKY